MDIGTVIFALAIALAFGAVWWITSYFKLNTFLIPFLSMLAAMAVFFSHSLLGIKV